MLTGPKNFQNLNYWSDDVLWIIHFLNQSFKISTNKLTEGQFAQKLKNGSDIYEHVRRRMSYCTAILIIIIIIYYLFFILLR